MRKPINNILFVNSSILGDNSHSTSLSQDLIARIQAFTKTNVTERQLTDGTMPHLDSERLAALVSHGKDSDEQRSQQQQTILDHADTLLEEVKQADIIVIGLPMYNFGVPSQFKAWMDHLARSGVSFRYTENGPEGLLDNKPVYVLAARGGFYANTDQDHQTPFIKQFFSMLGLTDIHFIYAEGVNISPEQKQRSLKTAHKEISRLTKALEHKHTSQAA